MVVHARSAFIYEMFGSALVRRIKKKTRVQLTHTEKKRICEVQIHNPQVQPLDAGIIQAFKAHYRTFMRTAAQLPSWISIVYQYTNTAWGATTRMGQGWNGMGIALERGSHW